MPGDPKLKMYLVPCSCGTTFAVSENYDRQGTPWSRYLKCPNWANRMIPRTAYYNSAISTEDTGRWMSAELSAASGPQVKDRLLCVVCGFLCALRGQRF